MGAPDGLQRHQHGALLHVAREIPDVFAAQHLADLFDGEAVRRGMDLGGLVDLGEGSRIVDGCGERRRRADGVMLRAISATACAAEGAGDVASLSSGRLADSSTETKRLYHFLLM